jgi:hypothetical protein
MASRYRLKRRITSFICAIVFGALFCTEWPRIWASFVMRKVNFEGFYRNLV